MIIIIILFIISAIGLRLFYSQETFERYIVAAWKAVGDPAVKYHWVATDRKVIKWYFSTILGIIGANFVARIVCSFSYDQSNGTATAQLEANYGTIDSYTLMAIVIVSIVFIIIAILYYRYKIKELSFKSRKKTLVIMYAANIANDIPILSYDMTKQAIPEDYEPSDGSPIRIQLENPNTDKNMSFWMSEDSALRKAVNTKVFPYMQTSGIQHVSLFALAPMPLLVRLGTLLNEKYSVEVFQKHRSPDNWDHLNECTPDFILNEPTDKSKRPVLVLSLSASIIARIKASYGQDASIWEVTVPNPNMDMMRTKKQQDQFCRITRDLLSAMSMNPDFDTINVHMAVPISCAIELGRVWMPKAHNALRLYDYSNGSEHETITIKNEQYD